MEKIKLLYVHGYLGHGNGSARRPSPYFGTGRYGRIRPDKEKRVSKTQLRRERKGRTGHEI